MEMLIRDGLCLNGYHLNISIRCFICDSPARAFLKGNNSFLVDNAVAMLFHLIKILMIPFIHYFNSGTVNFNHHNGCQKCDVSGTHMRRMVFPILTGTKRTNESFRARAQPTHHKERSIIENLPIDMVQDIIVSDALHLLEHGVMKKLLIMWIKGSTLFEFKFTKSNLCDLDRIVFLANKQMPSDIHRCIRAITVMKYWKGTEFRTFLLYTGIVILKDYLDSEAYDHFLVLFCAIRICSCNKYRSMWSLAGKLFKEFVDDFILIYGEDHVVSNIHNLIHVYDEVKRFGNLNSISSYKFENFLGHLKMRVQSCGAPLEQIARRLIEEAYGRKPSEIKQNVNRREWQPVMKYQLNVRSKSDIATYKFIQISPSVFLSIKKNGDRFFLTKKKEIVRMNHALHSTDGYFISGEPITEKKEYFENPFSSDYIDIYISDGKMGPSALYKINEIACKLLCLEYNDDFVFMPILHSLDELN